MKQCTLCKEKKPTHDFHQCSASKDSLSYHCKSCVALKYQEKYKEKYKEKDQERYLKNRAKKIERAKQWRLKNKDRFNAIHKKYRSKPQSRIKINLRRRIKELLFAQGVSYDGSVGCSKKELVHHLESRMLIDMTWDNYGKQDGWCIDHIKPLACFNMKEKEQRHSANHFLNLQPLWNFQNIKKSDNYNPEHPMGWRGLNSLLSDEDKQILTEKFNYKLG